MYDKKYYKLIKESSWINAIDLKGNPIKIKTYTYKRLKDGKIFTGRKALRLKAA